ncbi:unnamed protein product, partial [Discosporangium mesarthrocarpum]
TLAVAYPPWTNGTEERMMREVVRTLKAMLNEAQRSVADRVDFVPAVQFLSTPYHVMYGRAPRTAISTLAGGSWSAVPLEPGKLSKMVQDLMVAHEEMHKAVLEPVERNRARQREAASRGIMPNFSLGDFVMVAGIRKRGSTPKLVSTWTGPWRVVGAEVQDIVNGELQEVHACRLRFYADKDLVKMTDIKRTFQYTHYQVEFEMETILDVRQVEDEYRVLVDWLGFEGEEETWESLANVLKGSLSLVRK